MKKIVIAAILGMMCGGVSAAPASKSCSKLRKCSGVVREIVNGKWENTSAGKSIDIPEGKLFCMGATYNNPGVKFDNGVSFIVHVIRKENRILANQTLDASIVYMLESTFVLSSSDTQKPVINSLGSIDSGFLGASAMIDGRYYDVVCTQ
ncbi:MAG: hypothetical protein PHW69_08735 [Elusimicrobiaceae bacterium]|nr:hypothetical protein [Elusimicrobiaceae bacterium]